jgi:hypothetical protein
MGFSNSFWTSDTSGPAYDFSTDEDFDYLESGRFCVPILWSACFASTDVNHGEQSEEFWPEENCPSHGLSCDAPLAAAVERLQRRVASVKRVVSPSLHAQCDAFVAKLKQSQKGFVHLNLSDFLSQEEDPSDAGWKDYWGSLVEGLDIPVTRVRRGIMAGLFGLGLPSPWKHLWSRALDGLPLRSVVSHELDASRLTGASTSEDLRKWRA